MPQKKGCGPKVRSENIREMVRAGHRPDRAAAAAFRTQREQGCKVPAPKGGKGKK